MKSFFLMKTPAYIEFQNETESVLSRFLKAAEPEEGCAILIGQKKISKTMKFYTQTPNICIEVLDHL